MIPAVSPIQCVVPVLAAPVVDIGLGDGFGEILLFGTEADEPAPVVRAEPSLCGDEGGLVGSHGPEQVIVELALVTPDAVSKAAAAEQVLRGDEPGVQVDVPGSDTALVGCGLEVAGLPEAGTGRAAADPVVADMPFDGGSASAVAVAAKPVADGFAQAPAPVRVRGLEGDASGRIGRGGPVRDDRERPVPVRGEAVVRMSDSIGPHRSADVVLASPPPDPVAVALPEAAGRFVAGSVHVAGSAQRAGEVTEKERMVWWQGATDTVAMPSAVAEAVAVSLPVRQGPVVGDGVPMPVGKVEGQAVAADLARDKVKSGQPVLPPDVAEARVASPVGEGFVFELRPPEGRPQGGGPVGVTGDMTAGGRPDGAFALPEGAVVTVGGRPDGAFPLPEGAVVTVGGRPDGAFPLPEGAVVTVGGRPDGAFPLPEGAVVTVGDAADRTETRVVEGRNEQRIVTRSVAPQLVQTARVAQDEAITLTLSPEDLGPVRFEMHGRGAAIHVVLTIERPETLEMLRRNVDHLVSEFRQAGFSGASFSFSGAWSGGQERGAQERGGQTPYQAGPEQAAEVPVAAGRRQAGIGLDIRL